MVKRSLPPLTVTWPNTQLFPVQSMSIEKNTLPNIKFNYESHLRLLVKISNINKELILAQAACVCVLKSH